MATESLAAQMRAKRSELMISELEGVALLLFEERGFDTVTVEDIASAAHISVRTFYRYFPAKEDVLQVKIDRRSKALRAALATRPDDEAPTRATATSPFLGPVEGHERPSARAASSRI